MSQVMGWENIELISDRPLGTMLDEFRRLKLEFPDRQARSPACTQLCFEVDAAAHAAGHNCKDGASACHPAAAH